MKDYKILIVARSLPFHNIGGMEVVAWDLAQEFARLGNQVVILTTKCPNLPNNKIINNVKIHIIDAPSGTYSNEYWDKSAKIFREEYNDFDFVLGVSASANSIIKERKNSKAIFAFQAHGTSWGEIVSKLRQKRIKSWLSSLRNIYWGLFKDRIYSEYDLIISIGDKVDSQLREMPTKLIVGDVPVKKISNGVDVNNFKFDEIKRNNTRQKLGIPDNTKTYISLCRIHAQKGVLEALKAFVELIKIEPESYYIVAGDGPQLSELKTFINDNNLDKNVKFTGALKREQVADYLSAADVFVFTTQRSEGLPINILEALASGLPLIVSNGGCDKNLPCIFIDASKTENITKSMSDITDFKDRESKLPLDYSLNYSAQQYLKTFEEIKGRQI